MNRSMLEAVLMLSACVAVSEIVQKAAATRATPVAVPMESTANDCTWGELSDVLFRVTSIVCEYRAPLGVRVVTDSLVFVGTECNENGRHGMCLLAVTTNADAVIPNWNWRARALIRVQPGGFYIDDTPAGTPSIAFGRSVNDLAEKYPDAYHIGIKRIHSAWIPDFRLEDLTEARPSSRCKRDLGAYNCVESSGRVFFLR